MGKVVRSLPVMEGSATSRAAAAPPLLSCPSCRRSVSRLGAEDQVCFTAAEDSTPVAIDVDGISVGVLGRADRLTATVRPEAGQVVRELLPPEAAVRSPLRSAIQPMSWPFTVSVTSMLPRVALEYGHT
jgi:hypothetical protein